MPVIALTMGDPCGVGPEVIVKAFGTGKLPAGCRPIVIGDVRVLRRAATLTGCGFEIHRFPDICAALAGAAPDTIPVISPTDLGTGDMQYGRPSGVACEAAIEYIRIAAKLAVDGQVDGMCTCPINKAALHRAGFRFPGHTEFLQELTRTEHVVMMLAGTRLKVALATIHEPISAVPGLLTQALLERTIHITGQALCRDIGYHRPRLAIAGLNPHSGEDGRFGREELDLIGPVIEGFAREDMFHVSGPYPPDTVFQRAFRGEFDAVVAMYHDQGLIPIKLVHFSDAVNITLGLKIVRTSVDHGTAYDIAGTGKADEGSLVAALQMAALMARNRAQQTRL